MKEIIEVKGLKKDYETFHRHFGIGASVRDFFRRERKIIPAVRDVTFSIQPGEMVGLIGENGAGKSTTIKMLAGILHPTSGTARIQLAGKEYVPWSDRSEYVRSIGVVFGQKTQLAFDLPPLDTYELNRELYRIPAADYKKRLARFTKLLAIEDVITRPTRQLSLGERMKSELVAALLHAPTLVFLDEPTIGLDVLVKERIRSFIREVNRKEGITFILTTHDLQDIDQLCNRVLVLDKGALVFDGGLQALKDAYVKEKNIRIILDEPVKVSPIAGARIVRRNEREFDVRIPQGRVRAVAKSLVTKYPVKDITITGPTIEQVIAKLYNK